jgi:hypothetical protein
MNRHARPAWPAWPPLLAALVAGATGCSSCHAAPEPGKADAAATEAIHPEPTSTYNKEAWLARHPRDDAGNLIPKSSPPPVDPAELPPKPRREPDWDLDPDDAARDYVRIYAIATKRYGDSLDCVVLGPSRAGPGGRRVEVKAAPGCADAGGVIDVFVVDVAADHLTVDDKSSHLGLARWPDGSDPEGPPAKPVRQVTDMKHWTTALHDAITTRQLVAIRLQTYGRGTYPIITLAGWHGAVHPGATPDDLKSLAQDLCHANGGLPLAFFAGIDRANTLLIRCPFSPANVRWDRL